MSTNEPAAEFDVAIVGGGFSGVMVAINAARSGAAARLRIVIIERSGEPGRGTAYAELPHDAILNVPAGAMGAFPGEPGGFAHWLGSVDPAAYVPRHQYGAYVQALLARARTDGHSIPSIQADVADLIAGPAGRILLDGHGKPIATAGCVVLALGAPPPADLVPALPPAVRDHPAYVANPWTFLRAPAFAPAGTIVVAGTGLTALDVIAAFARSGARSALHVVSRGGRYPLAHARGATTPIAALVPGTRTGSVRAVVAQVRAAVRSATAHGSDWRDVMDGLRPAIAGVWSNLDLTERRRFLRHVRPLFDPHRHRAPAELLAHKNALTAAGRLITSAARIGALRVHGTTLEVSLTPRGSSAPQTVPAAQLINCGGPANDYAKNADPLVSALLARGEIAIDPTGLGLRALPNGRLIDDRGRPSRDLFTIGWPMRGTLFESTAVRELREHALILGREVAAPMRAQCGA